MKDGKKTSELWVVVGLIAAAISAIAPALMRYVDQWPAVALIVSALAAASVAVNKYIDRRTALKIEGVKAVGSLAQPKDPS